MPTSSQKARTPAVSGGNVSCFPIVGVGASAGGLEALTALLKELPADTGMTFLLVQHLDPRHESKLTDLLAKVTGMKVTEAREGMTMCANCVFVIPPNKSMALVQGVLKLTPRGEARLPHLAVDILFKSLAEDLKSRAIGVVLSGTGSDGSQGLAEIKAAGGITFAQDEASAKYSGMPASAVQSGCVDFVLPPDGIARELVRIGRHPYVAHAEEPPPMAATESDHYRKILALVRTATGVNFEHYRETTIRRRILRRMAVHSHTDLAEYASYLEKNRPESHALYENLLITVTSFFRDPAVFKALQREVFPALMRKKPDNIRIWSAGCSTGQETYSLAIALLEFLEDKPQRPTVQIFGTDIADSRSIEKARVGLYLEAIEREVSPERLRRYFTKETVGYRVRKSVRELCVFAKQNVMADPPFSRLDLISCRNVLIYLAPVAQRRVIETFHYALSPGGFLVLGESETVGEHAELFGVVDKKQKIYSRKTTTTLPYLHAAADPQAGKATLAAPPRQDAAGPAEFQREADRLALGRYAPAGVLINDNLDILQFRGRTDAYLSPPVGEAKFNLLRMARETLALELGTAIREARTQKAAVRREAVRLQDGQQTREINIEVTPVKLPSSSETCFLVLFEEATAPPRSAPATPAPQTRAATPEEKDREIAQLQRDLVAAKDYLQSVIEQQDAANEELKSASEEILSSNQELQSTNEELETSKEELESANEELTTLNEELRNRNTEVNALNNDLINVLSSVQMPVIVVATDLRIRRFNTPAGKICNLIPVDVGRAIGDLRLNVAVPELQRLVADVIGEVVIREREVQDGEGHWYMLRIQPYRTADHRIDGAVIVLVNIDGIKHAEEARGHLAAIVDSTSDPIFSKTLDGIVTSWNRAAEKLFGYTAAEMIGQSVLRLYPPALVKEERGIVAQLKAGQSIPNQETVRIKKNGQPAPVSATLSPVKDGTGKIIQISVILHDITERKKIEARILQLNEELEEKVAARTAELARSVESLKAETVARKQLAEEITHVSERERRQLGQELHDDLAQELTGIACLTQALATAAGKKSAPLAKEAARLANMLRGSAAKTYTLARGFYPAELQRHGLARALVELASWTKELFQLPCQLRIEPKIPEIPLEIAVQLYRIAQETVNNAAKHAKAKQIVIGLAHTDGQIVLMVKDDGQGLRKDFDKSQGMGQKIMRHRAETIGATLDIRNHPKGGVIMTCTLPAAARTPLRPPPRKPVKR
jgi:two-component system CheB/CheR fusion protein